MITPHHGVGARSFRRLWMLEELGLAAEQQTAQAQGVAGTPAAQTG